MIDAVPMRLPAREIVASRYRYGRLILLGTLIPYLLAGGLLAWRGIWESDTYSRLEIARRMLYSDDPHLAAIGFVWSPLPVFALVPLVALMPLIPALTTSGLAANIVSALCMAGAARSMYRILRGFGLGEAPAVVMTVTFAAHPLTLFYAANGMSEAMLLFFLLLVAEHLRSWAFERTMESQVYVALALAAAYLTRYEAAAAIPAVALIMVLITLKRTKGPVRGRLASAIADVAVACGPAVLAFVLWAALSYLITGQPFDQFTSVYGNASQVRASSGLPAWSSALVTEYLRRLMLLSPLLAVAMVGAAAGAALRRRLDLLAPALVLGSVMAFMAVAYLGGSIPQVIRYLIVAIPLAVLTAGAGLASAGPRTRRWLFVVGSLGAVGTLAISTFAMAEPELAGPDAFDIEAVFETTTPGAHLLVEQDMSGWDVARNLDAMQLPPGAVLMDDFLGSSIMLNSANPRQFVITSDRDFPEDVANPQGSGCTYILVPQPVGFGNLDALNRAYPNLYRDGAGFAVLVQQYQGPADLQWRLYQIKSPDTG